MNVLVFNASYKPMVKGLSEQNLFYKQLTYFSSGIKLQVLHHYKPHLNSWWFKDKLLVNYSCGRTVNQYKPHEFVVNNKQVKPFNLTSKYKCIEAGIRGITNNIWQSLMAQSLDKSKATEHTISINRSYIRLAYNIMKWKLKSLK